MKPDAIDRDARRQRIVFRREPLGQFEPAAARLDGRCGTERRHLEKAARHTLAELRRFARDAHASILRRSFLHAHRLTAAFEIVQAAGRSVLATTTASSGSEEHLRTVEDASES